MAEPLVHRLHLFFVRVFTTEDLFDQGKRQEMRLETYALDDLVAQLETDNKRLQELIDDLSTALLEERHSDARVLLFEFGMEQVRA